VLGGKLVAQLHVILGGCHETMKRSRGGGAAGIGNHGGTEGDQGFDAGTPSPCIITTGTGFTATVTGQLSTDGTAVENVTFDAIFTPDPANSTGRVAKYTEGSFRMIARVDSVSLISSVPGFSAPFDYSWSGEGSLGFKSGKK
jgi:hypothetical protein